MTLSASEHDILRRLARSQFALRFSQLVPDQTKRRREQYARAVQTLLDHGLIVQQASGAFVITIFGRRELHVTRR